jgi:hypothetical protein
LFPFVSDVDGAGGAGEGLVREDPPVLLETGVGCGGGTLATSCCPGPKSGSPGRWPEDGPRKPATRMTAAVAVRTPAAAATIVNSRRRLPLASMKIGFSRTLRLPTVGLALPPSFLLHLYNRFRFLEEW